jgi:hypothetical protein
MVFWRLELLVRLGSALTPEQVPLFASLANLIPLVAVILLSAHFPKVGGWLLFLAGPARRAPLLPAWSTSPLTQRAQNITLGLELNAAGTEYVAMPYYSVKLFPTN